MKEMSDVQQPEGHDLQCLHKGRILSCPPTSHTVNEIFLYSTVSTLKPVIRREVKRIRSRATGFRQGRYITDRRNRGDNFAKLELVQNRSFTSSVQADLSIDVKLTVLLG